jgi:hypothetical protein
MKREVDTHFLKYVDFILSRSPIKGIQGISTKYDLEENI